MQDGGPYHVPLKRPPSSGPAIAEQLQVMLSAWDHFARERTATISEVIVQTRLTMPPPPIPAKARARMSQRMDCAAPQSREPTTKTNMLVYSTIWGIKPVSTRKD